MSGRKRKGVDKLGLRAAENADYKLDVLDSVIEALEIACASDPPDDFRRTVTLHGFEASNLLRGLKAARRLEDDPFGIKAAFRENRGLPIPEKAALAREVRDEIAGGKSREQALLDVGARHKMNGSHDINVSSSLAKIYDELKDYI
ncbi:MAG: hypothetical protein WCY08_01845 [Rhodocyclaceae bacterium]